MTTFDHLLRKKQREIEGWKINFNLNKSYVLGLLIQMLFALHEGNYCKSCVKVRKKEGKTE